MNTHIVRVNEKIEKIASLYHLNIEEIIKMNKHIQDWDHLIPGTKIRLPEISEMVQIELDNTEPFIEEYYPKIDVDTIKDNVQEKEITVENSVDIKKEETEEKKPVGICPQCGKNVFAFKTKHGKNFYACEDKDGCHFMSWDIPTGEKCPNCGKYLIKRGKKIKCSSCDFEVMSEN